MLRGPAGSINDRSSTLGNAGFAAGGMTSSVTPNPWSPYFGEPIRELKLNPYSAYGRENWALPDAYSGSIPYMTQLMIHIIAEEDLWPTKTVAPIRVTESEMEVSFFAFARCARSRKKLNQKTRPARRWLGTRLCSTTTCCSRCPRRACPAWSPSRPMSAATTMCGMVSRSSLSTVS